MQSFKITRDELLKFAQRLYQEACCGYLDLCETVADGMVTDFLDGREPINPGILSNMENINISVGNGAFAGPGIYAVGGGPPMTGGVDPAGSPPPLPNTDSGFYTSGGTFGPSVDPAFIESVSSAGQYAQRSTLDAAVGEHQYQGEAISANVAMAAEAGVVITETPVIREEVFVRGDNYHGNPSERL